MHNAYIKKQQSLHLHRLCCQTREGPTDRVDRLPREIHRLGASWLVLGRGRERGLGARSESDARARSSILRLYPIGERLLHTLVLRTLLSVLRRTTEYGEKNGGALSCLNMFEDLGLNSTPEEYPSINQCHVYACYCLFSVIIRSTMYREYSYPGKPGTPEIDAHDTYSPSFILTLQDAVVLRTRTPPSLGPEQGISLLHPRILQTATVPSLFLLCRVWW